VYPEQDEYHYLESVSVRLEQEYLAQEDPAWGTSPFGWIKAQPSRRVGTIGERLVDEWLTARGFAVTRCPDSDADRLVNGKRVEIKFSTRWATGGYVFQQLRDQQYEIAILLGLSPGEGHCWVVSKADLMKKWGTPDLPHQHGGQAGKDTVWLSIDPSNPPGWIQGCDGSLDAALVRLHELT